MKTIIKKIIKVLSFLIIFCVLCLIIFKVLWLEKTEYSYTVYDEPKNSSDVVYIGSSVSFYHFNSLLAYNEYGFTTTFMSSGTQPFPAVKYLLKEATNYQTPKVYIIDISRLPKDFSQIRVQDIRRCTDKMKFSQNRIDAINKCLSYHEEIEKDKYIEYYFSFLIYHNRWKKLNNLDFSKNEDYYKGFKFNKRTDSYPHEKYNWPEEITEMPEEKRESLEDLINYIKQSNLNVIFVIPHTLYEESELQCLVNASYIIEQNGLKVINFDKLEDFNLDYSSDFLDKYHLNVDGASKYTLYFSKYLMNNYKLSNHKGDSFYESWDKEYLKFKKDYKKVMEKDFEEQVNIYKEQMNY